MKLSLYLLPNKVGLMFGTTPERDKFWETLPIKPVSEKIGALTIRFYPDRIAKGGYKLTLELAQMPVAQVQAQTQPQGPAQGQGHLVNLAEVKDPFAITGQHVVKALPGLVSVKSNIPQEEPSLVGNPAQQVPAPSPQVVEEPKVTVPDDPEPTGIHRNSRKYREWLARQKK